MAILRGPVPQQTIADAMRARGWKWSQATVWSVEKGERPLRLLEAHDLADIFKVSLEDFFGDGAEAKQEAQLRDLTNVVVKRRRDFQSAAQSILVFQDAIRDLADSMGISVPNNHEEWKETSESNPRGANLYNVLKTDIELEARRAKQDYELYKQGKDPVGASSTRLIYQAVSEVRRGIDPEEA